MRRAPGLRALCLLLLSVEGGCDNASGDGCIAGRAQSCLGDEGCPGRQLCRSDGSGFDACQCLPDPLAPDGSASPGGFLGGACTGDDDCGEDLFCLTSADGALSGGGAPHGVCTADCTDFPELCSRVDANGLCVDMMQTGGRAFCFEACQLGTPGPNERKCHDRPDVACAELAGDASLGFCIPRCGSDEDCAPRVCDPKSGFCKESVAPGGTTGTPCAGDDECSGPCLEVAPGFSTCSQVCALGAVGCGRLTDAVVADAFCAYGESAGSGIGDVGFCGELCDCDTECAHPDAVCEPLDDPRNETWLLRQGLCSPKTLSDGTPRRGIPCN